MVSFLAGFGAGFALAILFAPNAGETSREFIGSKASEGVGYIKRQTDELRETALDMVDRSKDVMLRQVERLAAIQQTHGAEVYER